MKKQFYVASVLSAAMLLAACEGDDGINGTNGTNGADGADGFNSLVAFRDIPKGDAVCLGGGLAADSGLDTNRNDVLDAEEVTVTEILECAATPTLRALHAVPDAPAVDIIVNGAVALPGVDYGQGSGFVPVVEENNVQVEAIIPGGNATVIDADLSFDYSTETTVIAVGTVGGGISALPITNASDSLITQGSFRAQVVHAAPSAPPVDVYVTAFDADLTGEAPVTGAGTPLAFGQNTPQVEVTAGDYQIRVTAAGNPAAVVYDSGEIPLGAGADLMIVAVENTGPGDNLVQLVALDGTAATMLKDTNTPAAVVAAHLSPDAPAVDILADDNSTEAVEAIALTRNVSFPAACVLSAVPAPGDYTINVALNSDNSTIPVSFPIVLDQGDQAAAIVSGFASGNDPAITALPQALDARSVATETKLRITHASPSTGPVDLYLVAAGTDINTVDPTFPDVPFGADTTQLSVANAVYDAYVTPAGTKTAAISLPGLDFTAGGAVLEVIARDPAADGSEGALPLAFVIDYDTIADCPAP